jgi:hypothetical protein
VKEPIERLAQDQPKEDERIDRASYKLQRALAILPADPVDNAHPQQKQDRYKKTKLDQSERTKIEEK